MQEQETRMQKDSVGDLVEHGIHVNNNSNSHGAPAGDFRGGKVKKSWMTSPKRTRGLP
jgi:hypothetical protein